MSRAELEVLVPQFTPPWPNPVSFLYVSCVIINVYSLACCSEFTAILQNLKLDNSRYGNYIIICDDRSLTS